jgi:hypothetical protein
MELWDWAYLRDSGAAHEDGLVWNQPLAIHRHKGDIDECDDMLLRCVGDPLPGWLAGASK